MIGSLSFVRSLSSIGDSRCLTLFRLIRGVISSGIAGGGLLLDIAAPLMKAHHSGGANSSVLFAVNGWVRIASSGAVTLLTNTREISQGTGADSGRGTRSSGL
jgi:hypothetical protein